MRNFFIYVWVVLAGLLTISAATPRRITDPEEALERAREAFINYEPEAARDFYEQYSTLMKKKRKDVPEDVAGEIGRVTMMENMLSRVERITVVDSLVVDAEGFFKHYKLSPEAGRLVGGDALRLVDVEMAYIPQNNSEIFYAEADTSGRFGLMSADVLDDGTIDSAHPLEGEDLGEGGNAEYPFMLSDGMTLYFASDGVGSLGGYDIFLTRRDEDGSYLQPQNVGMPYNSPWDDYLLAIDESTGAGWWATDRNRIPGKVTIYVFIPSDSRVNIDTEDPDLVRFARLDSIVPAGPEAQRVREQIVMLGQKPENPDNQTNMFDLVVGSTGRIYHSLSDFRTDAGRRAMVEALDARIEIGRTEKRLAQLREEWSRGDQSHGIVILNLEEQLSAARQRFKEARNRAIREEERDGE